jgi:Arc/MetJ family transcription regulator
MKRTNVILDEALVGRGKRLTGIKTTRALIDHALRELVRRRRQRDILELRGQVGWEGEPRDPGGLPEDRSGFAA